jgi:hypothetical protein
MTCGFRIRIRGLWARIHSDIRMLHCAVCGSIGMHPGRCGVCGGVVREVPEDHSLSQAVSRRQFQPFWTATKIAGSIVIVLVAVSTVGAGMYLSARPSAPSCSNSAVNYPSCNVCSSTERFSSSTNQCFCTNGAVNGPKCNRWCANNAINPPSCDRCPDNQTDVVCAPGLPMESYKIHTRQMSEFDFWQDLT